MNDVWSILSVHNFPLMSFRNLRFLVIHVSRREHEIENLHLVIDYQLQLESEEPSHRIFSTLGKLFKCLMNKDSLLTTDTQRSGVYKTEPVQVLCNTFGWRWSKETIPPSSVSQCVCRTPDMGKGVSDVCKHIPCNNAWNSGNHRMRK